MSKSFDAMKPPTTPVTIENGVQNEASNSRRGSRHRLFIKDDQVFVKIHRNIKFSWVAGEIFSEIGKTTTVDMIATEKKNKSVASQKS
jgi:hypothetical protein